ncbi:hypothetical protein J6590_027880 [Homalodisca vitripennis]|nr:hypothetical protein J6590_027880 [Homalodisca vitripennis]
MYLIKCLKSYADVRQHHSLYCEVCFKVIVLPNDDQLVLFKFPQVGRMLIRASVCGRPDCRLHLAFEPEKMEINSDEVNSDLQNTST